MPDHTCSYCDGSLEKVADGMWACEDCGRAVTGSDIED